VSVLNFKDIQVNFTLAFEAIIIPSLILNLILALPVFILVKDISQWIYPAVENE
jgi:hypothetical protein